MTFYGFNVHAGGVKDVPSLLTHLHAMQPNWALVMDSLDLCKQMLTVSPKTNVIHRNYAITGGDDNVFARVTPARWLELRAAEAESGVWLHTTCEPGWSQAVIDWHVELMRLCIPRKIKLVVGNWSVGTPNPDDIKLARPLLQLLDSNRDQFVLGLHEYANAVITSGLVGGAPNGKDDKGKIVHPDYTLPGSWPLNGEAEVLTQWHMGRYKFWKYYCASEGIRPPRIVLTEVGFDDVSDIDWWTKTLPRTGAYTSIGGFKTLQAYWKSLFPDWSEDRAFYEQLKYAEHNIYQDGTVEGGIIYCYGHVDQKWDVDDVEGHSEFLRYLEADAMTTQTVYVPDTFISGDDYRISTPGAFINVHATPDVTSASIGKVPNDAIITVLQEAKGQSDTFRYIKYAGVTGWVAMQAGGVKLAPYIPPPASPAPTGANNAPVPDSPAPVVNPTPPIVLVRSITINAVQEQMIRDDINKLRADATAKLAKAQFYEDLLGLPRGA